LDFIHSHFLFDHFCKRFLVFLVIGMPFVSDELVNFSKLLVDLFEVVLE
jgi:hypothetical protein